MEYLDEPAMRARAQQLPQGQALVARMRRDVERWSRIFADDPTSLSGWGHEYFCSEDGSALVFDPEKAGEHRCPVCGKVFSGGVYDAAWVYQYRYQALMSALEAACLYRLDADARCLRHFERVIGFYSDHYAEFDVHGRGPSTSGNGKIMPQALNEAIFLTKTVGGLEMLRGKLAPEFVRSVAEKLLLPGAKFVEAQKKIIHNIPCWINAAVGTVGLFTGTAELIAQAFDEPLGLCDQVRRGITSDHFWYEGSIHYNFFTIESFMNLMLSARLYGKAIPADVERSVYEMVLAPCHYAFSSGALPNPNDGWPNVNLKTYTYLYEMADRVFDREQLRRILSYIYALPIERTPLPLSAPVFEGDYSMEWLMFSAGREAWDDSDFRGSYNFPSSQFAILRGAHVEAFCKYGHRSPSHAHADKMNVEVMAYGRSISRDLSNCGYAAPLCNGFYRTSAAHNTVLIDGRGHPDTRPGTTEAWNPAGPELGVRNGGAYPGVDFNRQLKLGASTVEDTFIVDGEEEHVIDWLFHVEGECTECPEAEPSSLGYVSDGYAYLTDIRRLPPSQTVRLSWSFGGGVTGCQTLETAGMEVFLCRSSDNPSSKSRRTVLVRARGRRACFRQQWEFAAREGNRS